MNIESTGEILDKTRELVIRNLKSKIDSGQKDGMDIILGCLNFDTLELMYSGANNSLLVFRNEENKLETIPADKQPVGVYEKMKPFSTHVLQLKKGDVIFAYSDGYADQFGGEKGKKFKYSNLNNLLLSNVHLPMEELSNKLNEVFEEWRGSLEQVDDVCVMGIKI
jgi:serine phosphatase RsbU (regulator of sigma subunit)